jgi:serine phosphatase RsbU (regulator of sigma subunit)
MSELVLRQVPLFAALPDDELTLLSKTLPRVAIPAGTMLFREGDLGDRCYVVLDGWLEIVKAHATPDERLLGVRGAGEYIGEMSLLSDDHRRSASVRARAEVQVLEITRAEFDALLSRHPDLAYQMVRVLNARLREADDATIRDLQAKNRELTVAYQELAAAHAQIVEKELLERDLQVAREIQESMLPTTLPCAAGFDFGVQMVPARMVGGDFFDLFPLGEQYIGVVIGDVSGKGYPAALFMALTRSLVRSEASRGDAPRDALQRVNRHLLDMNAAGMFVTVLYGLLDRSTGAFAYARAGHELPVLIDAEGMVRIAEQGLGHPLALFDAPAVDEQTVAVPPGGVLVLYTDGVPDALNPAGACFGLEGLAAALQAAPRGPGQVVCDRLLQAVTVHQGTAPQFDDVTLVTLCRSGPELGRERSSA